MRGNIARMKKLFIAMASSLVSAQVLAQSSPAPPPALPLPPLPVAQVPPAAPLAAGRSTQQLITWQSGTIACDGLTQQPLSLPAPSSAIAWLEGDNNLPKPVTLDFAIDVDGRPHAIKRSSTHYSGFSEDLEPALATARFKPGTPALQCQITYTATSASIDAAPIDALIEYSIFPGNQRLPKAGYDRVKPAGSDCFDPPPAVRSRMFPDFLAIPQAPGKRSWSMIGFDIDERGKPTKVRVFRTTGNAALDRAAVKAVASSRFEPGGRHGCLYPYWRTAPPLAAPPIPQDLPGQPNPSCPISNSWKTQPVLRFPETYRRRGVEGWAIIKYDVAPWGATGNVRVLASEPSEAFGQAALGAVGAATKDASPQGYVNCITRVRFEMGDPKKPTAEPAEAPPPF